MARVMIINGEDETRWRAAKTCWKMTLPGATLSVGALGSRPYSKKGKVPTLNHRAEPLWASRFMLSPAPPISNEILDLLSGASRIQ